MIRATRATRRQPTSPPDAWHGPPERLRRARDRGTYVLATHQPYGVWGGLAEDDRRQSVADENRRTCAPIGDHRTAGD